MSSDAPAAVAAPPTAGARPERRRRPRISLAAHGNSLIWLTGGALALSLMMIVSLLALIVYQGAITFWPGDVVRLTTTAGESYMGELAGEDDYRPEPSTLQSLSPERAAEAQRVAEKNGGALHRTLVRIGNFELTSKDFEWVDRYRVKDEERPKWVLVLERLTWGRFYGFPSRLLVDGQAVAETPETTWQAFQERHAAVRGRWRERVRLEKYDLDAISRRLSDARMNIRRQELSYGESSQQVGAAKDAFDEVQQWASDQFALVGEKIGKINAENERFKLEMTTVDGKTEQFPLEEVVRAFPPNQLSLGGKISTYFSRWWEFLFDDPREANSEGGVWPAIFGTVTMTLIMSVAVVPLGVLAALYLREYAKAGFMITAIRIAINNLAGVPSVVFGVFGLGFFATSSGLRSISCFSKPSCRSTRPPLARGAFYGRR